MAETRLSAMAKYRSLLGTIAFGISFSTGLLINRDLGKALGTGLMTFSAAWIASVIVDRQYVRQAEERIVLLKKQIKTLQKRRVEAYQAFIETATGQQPGLSAMTALQGQSDSRRLPAARSMVDSPQRALSWDLSAPIPVGTVDAGESHTLPTQIQHKSAASIDVNSSPALAKTLISPPRSQQAELQTLERNLTQLQQHIADQQQKREQLFEEIAKLQNEKLQLEEQSQLLQDEVQDLKRRRVELEQFLAHAAAKKQELEAGANPLQLALKDLQNQVHALQEERYKLNILVDERQQQKELLDSQIASLTSQQQALEHQIYSSRNGHLDDKPVVQPPVKKESPSFQVSSSASDRSIKAVVQPHPTKPEKSPDLTEDWTEFMVNLPESEFQVIKALVEQNNPVPTIRRIAEANLTMPELLVDSINERALDLIGDLIIQPGKGNSPATIVRDYVKTVKKLIKTYEYLIQ